VVDSAAPDPEGQIEAVREVLREIGAERVPELLVFNKCDIAASVAAELVAVNPGSVSVSARTGEGIDSFLRTLGDRLRAIATVVELLVPYERGDVLAAVHREGEVVSTFHDDGGVRVRARLSEASAGRLAAYVVADGHDDGR
jgi:GTP-binding protein HflX